MDKKTTKKNEIINASINLMYLHGYNGTSVKDITDAAGIPKGSFYNYFQDKEHYAVDALYYYYSERIAAFHAILFNKKKKPLDRIKEFFKTGISLAEKQDYKEGCFLGNMTQEMGNISELIADAAANIQNEIVSMIHKNLVEASENKELKTKQNLNTIANFIITSWQGALLRMKVSNDLKVLDDFYTVVTENLLK